MEEEGRQQFFHPRLFIAIIATLLGVQVVFFTQSLILGKQNEKQVLAASSALTPTPTLTLTPSPTATPTPTLRPKPTFTPTPTASPTATPTPFPTANPEDTANWDKLAQCETGRNWAEDTGNGYYGGLQFSQSVWDSVGGSGKPSDASRDDQILRGKTLWQRQGWKAWSICAKKIGLY